MQNSSSLEQQRFEISQKAIQQGSKSFRLASLFLDPEAQRGAYLLYRWCRHCDDVIDEGADPKLELMNIFLKTQGALADKDFKNEVDLSAFSGLKELKDNFSVPENLFFELLEGFRMDVEKDSLQTFEDLSKYCYHVAGVVGLMMNPILQKSLPQIHPQSHALADSLGRAMQLTNISRDIAEDFKMGRVYIPQTWLDQKQIPKNQILDPEFKVKTMELVNKLLDEADEFYQQGRRGLIYLPFRAAWSISVASFLYQGIGHKVRRRGLKSFESRTVLNIFEKLFNICKGSFFFLKDRYFLNKNSLTQKRS